MNDIGDRVVYGSFGKIFIEGVWQSNLNSCQARVALNKIELNLSNEDWVRHKKGSKKGTGTVSGYKVTSEMIQRGFSKFSIISKLDDPEAYGHERIRYDNVMLDELLLSNFTAGQEVTEEHPFTFEGYELLDPIVAS